MIKSVSMKLIELTGMGNSLSPFIPELFMSNFDITMKGYRSDMLMIFSSYQIYESVTLMYF